MKEINNIASPAIVKKPELVAPAGDVEKLRFAYIYGADAAYVGGGGFSLRAAAGLCLEEIREARRIADAYQRRLYVAVNIYADNQDLDGLTAYLSAVAEIGPDALIVSDPGVFALARENAPALPLHISTQANITNWRAARFWKELGARRAVLSRELSLAQAAEVGERSGLETEIFVHGALCVSYSGRCLLSSYLTGRSANQGDCCQPCRWKYALVEEQRPGRYLPVGQDERGGYILNSRDLCLIGLVPELMRCGCDAWKIEGRNKSAYYVANTTRVFRAAIDSYFRAPEEYRLCPDWQEELAKLSHRGYTRGFALDKPDADAFRYEDGGYIRGYDFAAILWEADGDRLSLEQRNHFAPGDELEILLPDGANLKFPVTALYDQLGAPLAAANHPRQMVRVPNPLPVRLSGPLVCRRRIRDAH